MVISRPPMSDEPTDALVTGKSAKWWVKLCPEGAGVWKVWARRESHSGLSQVAVLTASGAGYTLDPTIGIRTAGQEWEILVRDLLERLH